MFTGQIDVITNREDWIAPYFAQIELDDVIIDILNPDVAFDCTVTIKGPHHREGFGFGDYYDCGYQLVITGSIADGKVIASAGDDGPGFQWSFTAADLAGLRPGTYRFGIKTTTNGEVKDLVDGTLAVIEGN